MPSVDWQLSFCTRSRVCAPRHASWPQASPSNPGRPHFLWIASKELTTFYTDLDVNLPFMGARALAEFWVEMEGKTLSMRSVGIKDLVAVAALDL